MSRCPANLQKSAGPRLQAAHSGPGMSLTVRLPQRGGGFCHARLLGTIANEETMGAQVLQAEFTGVDDLVAQTEEQAGCTGSSGIVFVRYWTSMRATPM